MCLIDIIHNKIIIIIIIHIKETHFFTVAESGIIFEIILIVGLLFSSLFY